VTRTANMLKQKCKRHVEINSKM